jgi:hypothetical protein
MARSKNTFVTRANGFWPVIFQSQPGQWEELVVVDLDEHWRTLTRKGTRIMEAPAILHMI